MCFVSPLLPSLAGGYPLPLHETFRWTCRAARALSGIGGVMQFRLLWVLLSGLLRLSKC